MQPGCTAPKLQTLLDFPPRSTAPYPPFARCFQAREQEVQAVLPEILPELLKGVADDSKKIDAARVQEEQYRGGGMELKCFFRTTSPG